MFERGYLCFDRLNMTESDMLNIIEDCQPELVEGCNKRSSTTIGRRVKLK